MPLALRSAVTPRPGGTVLLSLGLNNTSPTNPIGGLIQGTDGAFYGITNYSGIIGAATVFKLVLP